MPKSKTSEQTNSLSLSKLSAIATIVAMFIAMISLIYTIKTYKKIESIETNFGNYYKVDVIYKGKHNRQMAYDISTRLKEYGFHTVVDAVEGNLALDMVDTIRFFFESDKAAAEKIRDLIMPIMKSNEKYLSLKALSPGRYKNAKPMNIEIWLY